MMLSFWVSLILIVGIAQAGHHHETQGERELREDEHKHPYVHKGELHNDASVYNYGEFNNFFQDRHGPAQSKPKDELHNDGTIHNYGDINNVFQASGSQGHGHGHVHDKQKTVNNYFIDEPNGGINLFGKGYLQVQPSKGKHKVHHSKHQTPTNEGKIASKEDTETCEEDSDVSLSSDAERIFSYFNDNPDFFVFDDDSSSSAPNSIVPDFSKIFDAKDVSSGSDSESSSSSAFAPGSPAFKPAAPGASLGSSVVPA